MNATSHPLEDMTKLRRTAHAMGSWQNAIKYLNSGRHGPALASYRGLVQEFPGVAQLWVELGVAAMGVLEFSMADQAFQQAMAIAPNDAAQLIFIGTQYSQFRRMERAIACLQRALVLDPSAAGARRTLASWLERSRRLDEAWECVTTLLAQQPKDGHALYMKAFLLHRKGLSGEAETVLRDLLKDGSLFPLEVKANACYLLGTVLDGFGKYGEALGCLMEAKRLRRQTMNTAALEQTYENVDVTRRQAMAELTTETLERWRADAADAPCPHPLAILCSAPRSGTTLLEQILGAHPGILVFDESYAFMKEVQESQQPQQSRPVTLPFLNSLTAAERAEMTGCYLKSLLRETEENPGHRLVLDKSPSRTAWLHVWLRLFPQSKVIIPLRDPRDVIISCYFQNIPLNWITAAFSAWKERPGFMPVAWTCGCGCANWAGLNGLKHVTKR